MPISKTDEELQAEMLELYCEAITADPSVQAPAGLQPELAETVQRMASGLTSLQAEPTFVEELHRRLSAQAQTLARAQMGKSPIRSRLAVALRRCTQQVRPIWALGGLAVVAALLLFVALQPSGENRLRRALIDRGTQGPVMPTSGPAATVAPGSTEAPGLVVGMPRPGWVQTGQTTVSDQGITLAFIRGIVHEPRFIILFVAVGGPAAADGSPYLPVDLQVLDPTGHVYPGQVTWLDSTHGVTLAAVTLTGVDPSAASLRLGVTEMRASQGPSLHGSWQVEPIQRFQQLASDGHERLSGVDGLQCFSSGAVTIGSHCYAPCEALAALTPAMTASPAALVPSDSMSTATPPPLQGTSPTAVPYPTQPPAPLPPTVAPAPSITTTVPLMPDCDFVDWEHGLFGTTLLVSGPERHAVYVLVTRENGQVRRVSEQQFAEARKQAH